MPSKKMQWDAIVVLDLRDTTEEEWTLMIQLDNLDLYMLSSRISLELYYDNVLSLTIGVM